MAETPTLFASNTTTVVVGTENFVSSPNVAGVFQFVVDKSNMVAGDVVELRVYRIVLTGGTARVAYLFRYTDVQPTDDMIAEGPVIGNDLTDTNSLRFSILQTKGTARAFAWKVIQY